MGENRNIISDEAKTEIAKELGVYEKVKANGWRDVSSKDCGNIVKVALERAERLEKNL